MAGSLKIGVCAIFKDEAPFLVEWIAFHNMIGVDHFVLYDNGSTDHGPDQILDSPFRDLVTLIDWPHRPGQTAAYQHCIENYLGRFDWMAFIDVDEFIHPLRDDNLPDLLARAGGHPAMLIQWMNFGPSGHVAAPDGLVLETYTCRLPVEHPINRHVKSIVRASGIIRAGGCHIAQLKGDPCNADGATIQNVAIQPIASSETAVLNHYYTKSRADWGRKVNRGRATVADEPENQRKLAWFEEYEQNATVGDHRIGRFLPDLRRAIAGKTSRHAAESRPVSVTSDGSSLDGGHMSSIAAVCVVKNEADDLAEWLGFHLAAGVKTILVYDNGSTDETRSIALAFSEKYDVRVIPWSLNSHDYQRRAYMDSLWRLTGQVDWIAFIDADEFITSRDPQTTLRFLDNIDADVGQICLNWAAFGSSGHDQRPDGLVIESYTMRSVASAGINRHVKSLVRPAAVRNCINPHAFQVTGRTVDTNLNDIIWSNRDGVGLVAGAPLYDKLWINHYWTKSKSHWLKKLARGYHDILDDRRGLDELTAFDGECSELDLTLSGVGDRVRDMLQGVPGFARDRMSGHGVRRSPAAIFDIGMSEGNDSAFYLAKGFQVVGVEADRDVYRHLTKRFRPQIEAGQITIYNLAAGGSVGKMVRFFHHQVHQGLSGLSNQRSEFSDGNHTSYEVATIDWDTLTKRHGIPHYVKIDIEGAETDFLTGMRASALLPEFISVECHTLQPVESLYNMGYRLFRLIDQNPPSGFRMREPQSEGSHVGVVDWSHTSGPFGRDLPDGEWLDFEHFRRLWHTAKPEFHRTWFDCHAWAPTT